VKTNRIDAPNSEPICKWIQHC